MSSITAADLKLGGRLTAACDAIGANRLRTAAGILMEVAGELSIEAETTDGLLAPDPDDWSAPLPAPARPAQPPTRLASSGELQMCARNVHAYGPTDTNGWSTCQVCGIVNVASAQGGPIDLGRLA